MYLELLEIHQKACAEHDRFSAETTERNYVWEAALAIYTANRGVMGIEYAFDKANEFVAEGKKRNHI